MIKIYAVGGSVRDEIIGRPIHDKDYVVVGSSIEEMQSLGYKQVGKEFPVFLHPETGEEYALARKEVKTGDKHTDFRFEFGPDITLEEDLRRRDFTMNAIAKDLETGKIIDPFNGIEDIKNKTIRHVDSTHFIEDPLRVLRLCQFATRFNFKIAYETIILCRNMVKCGMLSHLTSERIWKEVEKALYTTSFFEFLLHLEEVEALYIVFPEIMELKNVPENEIYHPEGNTFTHTLLTLNQVYGCFFDVDPNADVDTKEIALLNFCMLCHDLGKLDTLQEKWPAHHGHDELGAARVNALCDRLKIPNEYRDAAIRACTYHMRYYEFMKSRRKTQFDFVSNVTDNFRYFDRLTLLHRVHRCDLCGRAGNIDPYRIENYYNVTKTMNKIFNIMENVTLKDLPEDTQEKLLRFKGEKFGNLYRDAKISYLKAHWNR